MISLSNANDSLKYKELRKKFFNFNEGSVDVGLVVSRGGSAETDGSKRNKSHSKLKARRIKCYFVKKKDT